MGRGAGQELFAGVCDAGGSEETHRLLLTGGVAGGGCGLHMGPIRGRGVSEYQ